MVDVDISISMSDCQNGRSKPPWIRGAGGQMRKSKGRHRRWCIVDKATAVRKELAHRLRRCGEKILRILVVARCGLSQQLIIRA